MDGSFDHLKPARRAIEIRKYVLEQYEALGKAFVDDRDFAKNVKDYTRPLGNTHNSVAWRDAEIELTSGDPNREQQVLTDLAAAPAHERAILAADENFIKMLQQHASPEFVAQVRKVLAENNERRPHPHPPLRSVRYRTLTAFRSASFRWLLASGVFASLGAGMQLTAPARRSTPQLVDIGCFARCPEGHTPRMRDYCRARSPASISELSSS